MCIFCDKLSQKEINLEKLQRIADSGLPEGRGLRATTWKVGFLIMLSLLCFKVKFVLFFSDEITKYQI